MAGELESASSDERFLAGLTDRELERESIERMVAVEERDCRPLGSADYRGDAPLQRTGWELARRRGEVDA